MSRQGRQAGVVCWESHGGSSFTLASRHKVRIFASVQLFWTGPQMPSDAQSLFIMPLLFRGHGACATKPALVTFQATTSKSSGQVVSPSEDGSVRSQWPRQSQSFCFSQKPRQALISDDSVTQGRGTTKRRCPVLMTSNLQVSLLDPRPTYPG